MWFGMVHMKLRYLEVLTVHVVDTLRFLNSIPLMVIGSPECHPSVSIVGPIRDTRSWYARRFNGRKGGGLEMVIYLNTVERLAIGRIRFYSIVIRASPVTHLLSGFSFAFRTLTVIS